MSPHDQRLRSGPNGSRAVKAGQKDHTDIRGNRLRDQGSQRILMAKGSGDKSNRSKLLERISGTSLIFLFLLS